MAAEHTEVTPNNDPVTDSERLARIESMIQAIHDEIERLRPFFEPLIANPAARWKARRNGRTDVQ